MNDFTREVPWTDAANALNRLVWDNQFYTEEEQAQLENLESENLEPERMDEQAETETVAEETDAEEPDEVIPPLQPGETRIPAHDGIPAMRQIVVDLTPRETERPVFSYDLHAGDTVYLGDQPFIVENVGLFDVTLRDPSQTYPVLRAESKEMLQRLLGLDLRNDIFRPAAGTGNSI